MQNEYPELTKAEYDILRILWKHDRQTVREVHDKLQATHDWAYTTTKTMMDRMVSKNLVERETFHGIYLYKPLISRPMGLVKLVQFFADRVLEMDSVDVVSLFAKSKAISPKEIKELEKLLKDEEKDKK
jgi:predicted transcriptional regulator